MRITSKRTNVLALALSVAFVTGCGDEGAKTPAAMPVTKDVSKAAPKLEHPAMQPLVNIDPKPVVAHMQPVEMPAAQTTPRAQEPTETTPEASSEPKQEEPATVVKQEEQKAAETPANTPEFVRPTSDNTKVNPNKPKVLFARNASGNDWDAVNASGFTNTTHFVMPEFKKHQPVTEDIVVQQPAVEDIKVEEPMMQEPVVIQASDQEQQAQDPLAQEPVVETPVFAEPTIMTPVTEVVVETAPIAEPVVATPAATKFKLTDRSEGHVWLNVSRSQLARDELELNGDVYMRCEAPEFEPIHMIASPEYFEEHFGAFAQDKNDFAWNKEGIEFRCSAYSDNE